MIQLGYDPEYVLDKMKLYEANVALKYSYLKHKDAWEQARLVAYMEAATHSTKSMKMSDLMEFSWEKDERPETKPLTEADRRRLRAKARRYEEEMKKK